MVKLLDQRIDSAEASSIFAETLCLLNDSTKCELISKDAFSEAFVKWELEQERFDPFLFNQVLLSSEIEESLSKVNLKERRKRMSSILLIRKKKNDQRKPSIKIRKVSSSSRRVSLKKSLRQTTLNPISKAAFAITPTANTLRHSKFTFNKK